MSTRRGPCFCCGRAFEKVGPFCSQWYCGACIEQAERHPCADAPGLFWFGGWHLVTTVIDATVCPVLFDGHPMFQRWRMELPRHGHEFYPESVVRRVRPKRTRPLVARGR